jgi:Organic radical activating enzymes
MAKHYSINEIFYSLQGEGMRAGTANVFVRFAGCNLTCQMAPSETSPGGFDCDTEFSGGRSMTASEVIQEMTRLGGKCLNVILTGGEPLLQVDDALIAALTEAHWYIAIETNGSKEMPKGIHWVTCSPKVAEHAVRVAYADELKYVRHAGQALPRPRCEASHYLLSPAFTPTGVDRDSLLWCIQLVKDNPLWRLSTQLHKAWQVR